MLWLDMDGPQADLERTYTELTGEVLDKETHSLKWDLIKEPYEFFKNLPLAPDAKELWGFLDAFSIKHRTLSGVPELPIAPEVAAGKKAWLTIHRGKEAAEEAIFCSTRHKSVCCKRGDIIIDDYPKYKSLWEDKGGIWIHHTNAKSSLMQLVGYMTMYLGLSDGPVSDTIAEELSLSMKEMATLKQCLGLIKVSQLALVRSGSFVYHNKPAEVSDLLNKLEGAYKDLLMAALEAREREEKNG